MLTKFKQLLKPYFNNHFKKKLSLIWIKNDETSWLGHTFHGASTTPPTSTYSKKIEKLAHLTNEKGSQPLWEGYLGNTTGASNRMPNEVRSLPVIGNLFTYLVQAKKPEIIVEFGTAFGVSGMYFLAGLDLTKKGVLLTFDPNDVWAKLAEQNLTQISNRFKLTVGTFEENIEKILPEGQYIDIAFIDAIHTSEFVIPQLELVITKSRKGTIIILDDINFSADMKHCWEKVSRDSRFSSSAAFGDRVGILELK